MSARQCPHCERYSLKDDRCQFVVCGRDQSGFLRDADGNPLGCGRPWCFQCGKKLCGRVFNPDTGAVEDANEDHNHPTGPAREACSGPDYCPGGHDSHKS
jgi:hypothetical protein